jgi:hypothetical protein
MDELTDEDSGDMRGFVLIFNLNGRQLVKTNVYGAYGDFTAGLDSHNLFNQKQEPAVKITISCIDVQVIILGAHLGFTTVFVTVR